MNDLAESLQAERVELANVQFYGWAFPIAQLCFQHVSKLCAREKSRQPPRRDCPARWTLLTCSQIITKSGPNRASTAGVSVISQSIQSARCSPARPLSSPSRICVLKTSGRALWIGFGGNRRVSTGPWHGNGCPSHVRVVRKERSILVGCRCQAALLTGNGANTDPVCDLSPNRAAVDAVLREVDSLGYHAPDWTYRTQPEKGYLEPHLL